MKKILFSFICIFLYSLSTTAQSYLTLVDSITVNNAIIWGGISYDGQDINITTMMLDNASLDKHIHLVKFDTSLNQLGNPVQLTTNSDLYSGRNITDHKHLYLNNSFYVTYSLHLDEELFMFRTDNAGNRIGDLDTVALGSADPTNDMIFCTDSSFLHILHFYPPNRHIINSYDLNLNKVGTDTTSVLLAHNNIGGVVYKDLSFYMFTGNTFGHNSELILTQWDANWDPLTSTSIQTLVPSSNGDGNWFATGCVYDEASQLWLIGFQHIEQNTALNDEHIDIAVFDNNFNLLERFDATDSIKFRPHFLVINGYLYMVYDGAGNGVYINKYKIQNNTTGNNLQYNSTKDVLFNIYPNPSKDEVCIDLKSHKGEIEVRLFNLSGKHLKTTTSKTISLQGISKGIYVLKVQYGEQSEEFKILKK